MKPVLDAIIIGQGLAGSALALLMQDQQRKFHVIASPAFQAASVVAGGICNPVVAKRYVPSWRGEEFYQAASTFYQAQERKLNAPFFYKRNLYKLIGSEQEAQYFTKKWQEDPLLQSLSSAEIRKLPDAFHQPYGAVEIKQAANLEVAAYLQATRNFLLQHQCLSEISFEPSQLEIGENTVRYGEWEARKIIFCEGWYAAQNPWFPFLKFRFAKGEILKISIPGLQSQDIVKKQVYLVPQSGGSYIAGATYNWTDLDNMPTEAGKEELTGELKKMLDEDFTILAHKAGVRPATYDRRPFIGQHPEHKPMYIFNGLGTRGAMLAPLLAQQFNNFLWDGKTLWEETDIERLF